MKVKLLSTNGKSSTYIIVISKGDEEISELTDFAKKSPLRTDSHHRTETIIKKLDPEFNVVFIDPEQK